MKTTSPTSSSAELSPPPAVWGVGLMFPEGVVKGDGEGAGLHQYRLEVDDYGNMVNESGAVVLPASDVQSIFNAMQRNDGDDGTYRQSSQQQRTMAAAMMESLPARFSKACPTCGVDGSCPSCPGAPEMRPSPSRSPSSASSSPAARLTKRANPVGPAAQHQQQPQQQYHHHQQQYQHHHQLVANGADTAAMRFPSPQPLHQSRQQQHQQQQSLPHHPRQAATSPGAKAATHASASGLASYGAAAPQAPPRPRPSDEGACGWGGLSPSGVSRFPAPAGALISSLPQSGNLCAPPHSSSSGYNEAANAFAPIDDRFATSPPPQQQQPRRTQQQQQQQRPLDDGHAYGGHPRRHGPSPPHRHRQPPTIKVTTDLQGLQGLQDLRCLQQPQAIDPSTSPASASTHTHTHTHTRTHTPSNSHTPLTPDAYHHARAMSSQTLSDALQAHQQRPASVSPVSPGGSAHGGHPHHQHQNDLPMSDGALSDQMSRKRSWAEMDATPLTAVNGGGDDHLDGGQRSRANSATSAIDNSADMGDYSPRQVPHTIRRSDAPKNADNKYVCEFAPECQDLTFDRKCEWSKHMDKHDRPYRCQHAQCAKLQGFTYSGGLLRHEREVHGKHGGPKTQLICPYEDCKRHSGKGFTRKENLNEHIRRVHSAKDDGPPPPHHNAGLKREGVDSGAGANSNGIDDLDTHGDPVALAPELQSPEELAASSAAVAAKRRRLDNGTEQQQQSQPPPPQQQPDGSDPIAHLSPPFDEVENLKLQLQHLRNEQAEKDAIIQRMQQAEAQHIDRLRTLEDTVRQMQQVHQPAAALMQEAQVEHA